MAAFSRFQFFESRVSSMRALVGFTPHAVRFRASDLGEIVLRVRGAVCETLLFMWGLMVVAVSLLIVAGFFL
jgi:hypothetical protein